MRFLLVSLASLIGATLAQAQGGSNYSIIGIGDITSANGAFYDGVAGASTALPSPNHINLSNPAMWTYNKNTRLQFGYRFNQQVIESGRELQNSEQSIYQNNGMVDNISAIFAIDTALGISASAGLSRISDINYYIANGFQTTKDGLTVSGNTYYQGTGGINNAHLGAAFKPLSNLSIGASLGYYFGDVNQGVQTIFNENNGSSTDYVRDIRLSGVNYQLGLDYAITPKLNIALSYAADLGIETQNRLISFSNFGTSFRNIDTLESGKSDNSFPTRIGFGASYVLDRVRLITDVQYLDIGNFDFRPPENGELRNGISLAIGAERTPSRFAGARFGEKISYRLGLGYKELYYSLAGQDINEYFLSAGISLPLPGTAILDTGIMLGQRGTLESGLVQESFLRLNFAVSIGDTWFIPFEREFD